MHTMSKILMVFSVLYHYTVEHPLIRTPLIMTACCPSNVRACVDIEKCMNLK
jgi:hypothetical protein